MSEYVVKGAEPNETVLHTRTKNGIEEWMWLPVREEIVRCRDCRWYGFDVCACERRPLHMAVEPDGYCAWGERREDGE